MLKWLRLRERLSQHRLMVCVVAGILATLALILLSSTFQQCVQANEPGEHTQAAKEYFRVFVGIPYWCGGVFVKENGDAITALATVIMAIFTGTLWWASAEQGRLTQQSLDLGREEFIASRRAWLSIEDIQLKYPTKFSEDGIGFNIGATIKNIGQTPATGVWVSFESYFQGSADENFDAAQKRFVAALRGHAAPPGRILFPDDTLVQSERWADGVEKIGGAIKTRPNGERMLGFTIFVGVVYWIIGDRTPHITYFPHAMLNVPVDFSVSIGQPIEIPSMPFLAGEAD